MTSQPSDDKILSAFSLAGTTLISGFVGISAANLNDDMLTASILLLTGTVLAFFHFFIEKEWHKTPAVFFAATLAAFTLWSCLHELTGKPWITGAIVLAWYFGALLSQLKGSAQEAEKANDVESSSDD